MGTIQSNDKQRSKSPPTSKEGLNVQMNTKDLFRILKIELENLSKERIETEGNEGPRQYLDMRLEEIGQVLTDYSKQRKKFLNYQQQSRANVPSPTNKGPEENAKNKDTSKKGPAVVKQDKYGEIKKGTIEQLQKENFDLRLRLSKVAGAKLVANNPHIADLSDPYRPTKLAEIYCELYDNEYTDAIEGLTDAGLNRKDATRILRKTLLSSYSFCVKKSKQLIRTVEDAVKKLFDEYKMTIMSHSSDVEDISREWMVKADKHDKDETDKEQVDMAATFAKPTGNLNLEEKLTKLRKEVSISLLPMVQKAYLKARWNKSCLETLKPFIKKCLNVTWCMVVMTPPLIFLPSDDMDGKQFDQTVYSPCTKSGPRIDYVVWPALCLHEGGPLLSKGIAEGRKE